jgi:formate hydrogenlyase transcriptional activator
LDKAIATTNSSCLAPDQYLTLLELSKAIALHRNLPDLFHDLSGRLRPLFDFHNLGIVLHDEAKDVLRLQILETNEPSIREIFREIPIEGSISGSVWRSQTPFVSPDIQQETGFTTLKIVRDYPVKAVCYLPLTTARKRLGVFILWSNKANVFDNIDLEFAQLMTSQIAVAVENALNFEEAQSAQQQLTRERDQLSLLLEVSNAVVSTLDLRELLATVATCVRRIRPYEYASLALFDSDENTLQIHALDFEGGNGFLQEGLRVRAEDAPSGRALMRRETMVMTRADLETIDSDFVRGVLSEGFQSGCFLPLISHGRPLGVLVVASGTESVFPQSDVALLQPVANQIAVAVENTLGFTQIVDLANKLTEEKLYLEEEIRTQHNFDEIIGDSAALKRVLQEVETVAATDATVLICGETGTGKELIARALHNLSTRRERTLVKVNCGAIPTGLLESEMFGHEKGAFTGAIAQRIGRFELAHRGTIFLDEVEDIPLELQPKLLRVLQEQELERLGSSRTIKVDARVVAATNVNLSELVAEKKFRSDLFYRLNVVPVTLPPLRERTEDIPQLVYFFTQKFTQRMRKQIERIPSETMAALSAYHWPGNIRELQNLIERSVTLSRGSVLEVPLAELKQSARANGDHNGGSTLEAVERDHILRVLEGSNWVIGGPAGAATRLGLKRTTLNNRIRKLGITRPTA